MLTIALPKGRIADETLGLFKKIYGEDFAFEGRELIMEKSGFRFLNVRNQDVPTYVLHGAADLGISGLDVLNEREYPITTLLDLGIGKCNIMIGMKKGERIDPTKTSIRVATKQENIAKAYFATKAMAVEVVKLNGSIELAPLVGLADAIVDIVETGTTMKENGLEPIEKIMTSTAHLFANKNSFVTRKKEILALKEALRKVL
jgi:ATP phosphoribosyltransferase